MSRQGQENAPATLTTAIMAKTNLFPLGKAADSFESSSALLTISGRA